MAEADREAHFRAAVQAALSGRCVVFRVYCKHCELFEVFVRCSKQARDEATSWLQSFRTANDARKICFAVLGSDSSSRPEQLFAAQVCSV